MADNINLNLGSGGDQLAADDIGGIKYQRVKMAIGADGVDDGDISSTNPLPVLPTPDAVSGFITTANLGSGATYASPLIDIGDYNQVDTRVVADTDGTIVIEFCSDNTPTVVRTLTIPYVAANGFQLFSAPAFTPYVKYTFNNSATPMSGPFYFETKLLSSALSPQVLRLDGFVSPSMVSTVGRSAVLGYDPASASYKNANVTEVTNDTGTTYNLNVVSGARPSQVYGRSRVQLPISITADTLLHTVTVNKKLYITDMIVTIDNTDAANSAHVSFQDAVSATPLSEVIAFQSAEAPSSASEVSITHHSFNEPVEFSNGVFIDVQSGIVDVTGILMGYEE